MSDNGNKENFTFNTSFVFIIDFESREKARTRHLKPATKLVSLYRTRMTCEAFFFLNIYSFGYINNIVSVYPSFSFMPYQSGRPIILTINVIKCVLKWSTLSSLFHLIFILNRSIFWLFFLFLSSSVCPKQRT